MYHEGMQVLFFHFYFFLKGREVAFSYIFNFLRTAETISMNLGRSAPTSVFLFQNNLHKVLMTGVLCTVCGTFVFSWGWGYKVFC
jgi:hypothetical protein